MGWKIDEWGQLCSIRRQKTKQETQQTMYIYMFVRTSIPLSSAYEAAPVFERRETTSAVAGLSPKAK